MWALHNYGACTTSSLAYRARFQVCVLVHTVAKFALPAMLAEAEKSSGFCSRIWWLYSAFIFSKNMSVVGRESMISPTLIAVKLGANLVSYGYNMAAEA